MTVEHIGIDHVKGVLQSVTDIICDGIGIVKNGISFSSFSRLVHVLNSVKRLMSDATGAIPELNDLEGHESSELGGLAYACIKQIIDEIKK